MNSTELKKTVVYDARTIARNNLLKIYVPTAKVFKTIDNDRLSESEVKNLILNFYAEPKNMQFQHHAHVAAVLKQIKMVLS
jgi:hypothetical protein